MPTTQGQERAEQDTRTSGDSTEKVYVALTVGVAVAAFTVSIRLPDACFDGGEAIVTVYAAVRSVFFVLVPAVLSFAYLMKQNCRCQCKLQQRVCGIIDNVFGMLRFAFYYYSEIVLVTVLGLAIVCGNLWMMTVLGRCLEEYSATPKAMENALLGFEFIYMISEYFFISATVLMIVTIWVDNPESQEDLKIGQADPISTDGARITVGASRSTNTCFGRLRSWFLPFDRFLLGCLRSWFLPFDRFLLGYHVISILIMLVSSAADEGAQETTFSALRKCNSTFSKNMSECAREKIDEWTNKIFTPLKVQFCFVTLVFLVSVLMKHISSKRNTSRNKEFNYSMLCNVIPGIVIGVICFGLYGWVSVSVIITSNSTTNATALTMTENTSEFMNIIERFVIAQVVYEIVLLVAAVIAVGVTIKYCNVKEKQDSGLLKGIDIHDVIVILTSNAVSIHCVFNLVSFGECKDHKDCDWTQEQGLINWQIASLSLDIVEGLLQAYLLLMLNSRHPIDVKTGTNCRDIFYGIALFFLSLTNLAIGLADCLIELREARSARGYLIDYSFPTKSWTFVTQAYYPLVVYFRLYSANAFWKRGVKLLNYDNDEES